MFLQDQSFILRAPRLNANDDAVQVTRWIVQDGATVEAGQPVAEIETEKATSEVSAGTSGLLVRAVAVGVKCPIGAPLAAIGPTLAAAQDALHDHMRIASVAVSGSLAATAKAQALAGAHGIDLARVAASGATIKERDVARHLADRRLASAASTHDAELIRAGRASPHQLRVARELRAAVQATPFTTLSCRLDMRGPERTTAAELAEGRMVSPVAILLAALGKVLPDFPLLISLIDGDDLYRYRDLDVAFAVRSPRGDLYAPVVRHVDRLSLAEIARECARLAKAAMRGKLNAKDIGSACFTLSSISIPNVESFTALPLGQTAILALASTRQEIEMSTTGFASHPVATATVTYDHSLCDGTYVAEFCAALDRALQAAAG